LLEIKYSSKIKKQMKLIKRQNKDMNKLVWVLNELANKRTLPESFCDHKLTGNLSKYRECHIEPDWLLVYKIEKEELVLVAVATGSHTTLFG